MYLTKKASFWGVVWVAVAGCQVTLAVEPLAPGAQPGAQRMETTPLPTSPAGNVPAELFQIPTVMERPLDVDQGPTVKVSKFELTGFDEGVGPHGGPAEAARLADEAVAQRSGEFTIGQIQAVATAITNYYRSRGFLYATVIVPVQDVQGATVRLELLIGKLGRVMVEGNKRYSQRAIESPFKQAIGKPLEKDKLESVLLRLNDYPGLAVSGVVQPGKAVGEGDLVARVQKEQLYDFSVGGDNYGRRETGHGRLHGQGALNNPLGVGDQLALYFQHTIDPANGKYLDTSYRVPLWYSNHDIKIFYRFNDFDVVDLTRTGLNIAGVTEEGGFEIAHHWVRGRVWNLSSFEGLTRKSADTFVDADKRSQDLITVAHARLEVDFIDRRFAGANGLSLEYRRGIPGLFGALNSSKLERTLTSKDPRTRGRNPSRRGSSGFASGEFDSFHGSLYRLQSMSILSPALATHKVVLRVDGQFSNSLLIPFEQFAAGGIQSVRAYEPSRQLYDKGVFGSIEYQMPPPFIADKPGPFGHTWGELIQLSLFYDYAWGVVNSPLSSQPKPHPLRGIGGAVQFRADERILAKITLATPLDRDHRDDKKHDDNVLPDPRLWFELNYSFF